MARKSVDIGRIIDEETEKRLVEMQDPNYEWPEKADKKDAIAIVLLIVICIVLIVLCMTGVIV